MAERNQMSRVENLHANVGLKWDQRSDPHSLMSCPSANHPVRVVGTYEGMGPWCQQRNPRRQWESPQSTPWLLLVTATSGIVNFSGQHAGMTTTTHNRHT
jgi:hypothetical protein